MAGLPRWPGRTVVGYRLQVFARELRFPPYWPCRRTLRRRANLYLNRWEYARGRTRLRSYPWLLSVEPTNACNLECPFCFTGAGGLGRRRGVIAMPLFRALLDEIGDYVVLLKAYGWGEPLACRHLDAMIAAAHARGIWTVINTNLALPWDARRAEALVTSGLDELVVSIDGARQETYARYRVGGRLEEVVANIRLLAAAKRRLGSPSPRLSVEFHPFPWNVADGPAVSELAREIDAALRVFKGCVPGKEWRTTEPWDYCVAPAVLPCASLWSTAVVAADGGVAPCTGTFYADDDMGRLEVASGARRSFRTVWNNERYRAARRFFRARDGSAAERRQVCFDCPATTLWERWQRHRAAGGREDTFAVGFTTNDAWNYFWSRRPAGAPRLHGSA